jgi:ribosomal protein S12 methylthiotransferase accessory factor
MFNTLNRPYKKSNPEGTITKIKDILKEIDLVPSETFSANPYPEIYSMRLELPQNKGSFGTNGKGRSMEYSVASGYAEFMERLQNNIFGTFSRTLMKEIKKEHGFYYAPDEKYITKEDFFALPNGIIEDIITYKNNGKEEFIDSYCKRLEENGIEGIVSIPFYDTKNKKLEYIPVNLLSLTVGSNGMAAGNTVPEAIFQGLCELMERWGAAEIFYNQVTPPTVPDEFLKQFTEEYKIIENIEKNEDYKVIVKDFSANKRIPSIGLMIIDKKQKKYKLNVGSDTCFQVALSRCLTEVHQGIKNQKDFENEMLDIPTETAEYFLINNATTEFVKYSEFSKFTVDNTGVYPLSLFKDTPDYKFDAELYTPKESYSEEVKSMIFNLHNMGYNVYIRDNSYLGFPSIMVYIPEVSALVRKNTAITNKNTDFNLIELDKIENLFFNFDNCSEDDLKRMEKILAKMNFNIPIEKYFSIEICKNSVKGKIDSKFFLTLLQYRLGQYEKAIESLKSFRENGTGNDIYYEIASEYMTLKKDGCSSDKISENLLRKGYSKEVVFEVCDDLSKPNEIFKYISLPKCPNCKDCGLKDECLTAGQMKICNSLYAKMRENQINQNSLASIDY